MSTEVENYMVNIVKQQILFREQNNVSRKDFIQILMQLRNNTVTNEDCDYWAVKNSSEEEKSLTIEQCAAQVLLFYIAGFDSSANMLKSGCSTLRSARYRCYIGKTQRSNNVRKYN